MFILNKLLFCGPVLFLPEMVTREKNVLLIDPEINLTDGVKEQQRFLTSITDIVLGENATNQKFVCYN